MRVVALRSDNTIIGRLKSAAATAQAKQPVSLYPATTNNSGRTVEHAAYWIEDQQRIYILPKPAATHYQIRIPVKPDPDFFQHDRIIFPLTSDHLITLHQFNVLRACLVNRHLVSQVQPVRQEQCDAAVLHVLPSPDIPTTLPQSLQPTLLQNVIPHKGWVDLLPSPVWRDNILLALGTFDANDLCVDVIGGMFADTPIAEEEIHQGLIVWNPPYDPSGWEISQKFWTKWAWLFGFDKDTLRVTNRWRELRGEDPLVI